MNRILIMLALATLALTSCSNNKATVTVTNDSGQTIDFLDVSLSGKTQHIQNLASGSASTLEFSGITDSDYGLNGKLADGTPLVGHFGYVTNGMNFRDSLEIRKKGIIKFDSKGH